MLRMDLDQLLLDSSSRESLDTHSVDRYSWTYTEKKFNNLETTSKKWSYWYLIICTKAFPNYLLHEKQRYKAYGILLHMMHIHVRTCSEKGWAKSTLTEPVFFVSMAQAPLITCITVSGLLDPPCTWECVRVCMCVRERGRVGPHLPWVRVGQISSPTAYRKQ